MEASVQQDVGSLLPFDKQIVDIPRPWCVEKMEDVSVQLGSHAINDCTQSLKLSKRKVASEVTEAQHELDLLVSQIRAEQQFVHDNISPKFCVKVHEMATVFPVQKHKRDCDESILSKDHRPTLAGSRMQRPALQQPDTYVHHGELRYDHLFLCCRRKKEIIAAGSTSADCDTAGV